MDHAERYFQLLLLGREAFLASVAGAALVRRTRDAVEPASQPRQTGRNHVVDDTEDGDTLVASLDGGISGFGPAARSIEVYPLVKKRGAAFADMITVGRTANNDVVLNDITVSRFHTFLRFRDDHWVVCDAGSKNGTSLDGARLEPRKETPIESGARLKLGDIKLTFYLAPALFDVLSGTDSARVR